MKEGNRIFVYLILKLLLAVGLLLLSQVLFYLWNTRIFHVSGFGEWIGIVWGNLRFGFATMVLVLLPYLLLNILPFKYRWNRTYRFFCESILYYIPVIAVLAVNCIDMCYYQFTYRRMSGAMFRYMGVGGDMGSLIPQFVVDYWFGILLFIALLVVLFWLGTRIRLACRNRYFNYRNGDIMGLVVSLLLIFFLGRGGCQSHFLRLTDAAAHCQPKNSALVTNTGFSILRTLNLSGLPEVDVEATEGISHESFVRQPAACYLYEPDSNVATNVVIIVLESFSQEYMGCYNDSIMESYTPFLDSLARHSILYRGRSNGKESIEGIPAVLASIPSLSEVSYVISPYCTEDSNQMTLPRLLHRYGYHSAFFHGCYNGSLGFDDFCKKIGFDRYYGMDEYNADPLSRPKDYDGLWGITDEAFLQYASRQLGKFDSPFFATIFTESSHHPYLIPDEHANSFKEGQHPLLRSVMYTDYSLRRFFDSISVQPWFYNTLFIITADHPGQGLHRAYNDYDGWYNIPMMIYLPWNPVHQESNRIVQQIDVLPSVADFLGLKDVFSCLGTSVFSSPNVGRQVVYGNGYYQLLVNDAKRPQHHRLALIEGDYEEGDAEDVRYLKSFLSEYSQRLVNPAGVSTFTPDTSSFSQPVPADSAIRAR